MPLPPSSPTAPLTQAIQQAMIAQCTAIAAGIAQVEALVAASSPVVTRAAAQQSVQAPIDAYCAAWDAVAYASATPPDSAVAALATASVAALAAIQTLTEAPVVAARVALDVAYHGLFLNVPADERD